MRSKPSTQACREAPKDGGPAYMRVEISSLLFFRSTGVAVSVQAARSHISGTVRMAVRFERDSCLFDRPMWPPPG